MKKRLNQSEIETARKSSRALFVISFILLVLLFVGFGFLYVMDVDLMSYVKIPQEKAKKVQEAVKSDDTKKEESKTTMAIKVDIEDGNIKRFFNTVKITDKDICPEGGYKEQKQVLVGSLSTKCRFSIASNIYEKNVEKTLDGKLYVKEEDVRNAYEELFGTSTYERQDSIPCLYKSNFIFRDDYYFTEKINPEEDTSETSYEKLLYAVRDGEKLDLTSVVIYYEHVVNLLCKDSRCNEVIEEIKKGTEYNEDYLSLYVDHNKNKLYQYTYHFEMDKAGFYRYVGYERTNE